MPRHENNDTPIIISGILYTEDGANGTIVDTHDWFMWLTEEEQTFSFEGVTFRTERRGNTHYWYAYKKHDGKLRRAYVGRSAALNAARLCDVAMLLQRETLPAT